MKSCWKRTNNNSDQGTADSAGSGFPLTPLNPLFPVLNNNSDQGTSAGSGFPLNPLNPLFPVL